MGDWGNWGTYRFEQVGTVADVGLLLGALGDVHYAMGDFERAIAHHECLLETARREKLAYAEGIALGSLGNIYESKGATERALAYHQQHLEIAQRSGDVEIGGNLLNC